MAFGVDLVVFALAYLGFLAFVVFIGYLVIKAAVRNGTIEAHHRLESERVGSAHDLGPEKRPLQEG